MSKHSKLAPSEYTQDLPKSLVGLPQISRLDDSMDEDGNTFHDVMEDKSAERPDLCFADDRAVLLVKLKRILSNLTESEQYVITKYFGLDGETLTVASGELGAVPVETSGALIVNVGEEV